MPDFNTLCKARYFILYKAKGEGKAKGKEAGLKPASQYVKAHPAPAPAPGPRMD